MDADKLAQKFHETYEALAPSFGYETREESRKTWEEVPEKNRNLMVAVCRVVLGELQKENANEAIRVYVERTAKQDDQATAHDRNTWQRRLGALITLVETFCQDAKKGRRPTVSEEEADWLLDAVYRVVNTSPTTGNIDDPYADIATLATRFTLEAAIEAGFVVPGPNAPEWMGTKAQPEAEEAEELAEESSEPDQANAPGE